MGRYLGLKLKFQVNRAHDASSRPRQLVINRESDILLASCRSARSGEEAGECDKLDEAVLARVLELGQLDLLQLLGLRGCMGVGDESLPIRDEGVVLRPRLRKN